MEAARCRVEMIVAEVSRGGIRHNNPYQPDHCCPWIKRLSTVWVLHRGQAGSFSTKCTQGRLQIPYSAFDEARLSAAAIQQVPLHASL